ncbi:hypothetical protein WN944_017771 [Citrus x changshan-huyou]|uniref:Uncharacterized protein n=1 Tax=Citrus x changshan-huyou TaxID=2935761 RepID=A0AAP0MI75_9ROSI
MKNQLTSCSFVEITIFPDDSDSGDEQQRPAAAAAATSSAETSDGDEIPAAEGHEFSGSRSELRTEGI